MWLLESPLHCECIWTYRTSFFSVHNLSVFSFLPPSTTLRRYQRNTLATTASEIGTVYCSIVSFANARNTEDTQEIIQSLIAIRMKLKRSVVLRTNIIYEVRNLNLSTAQLSLTSGLRFYLVLTARKVARGEISQDIRNSTVRNFLLGCRHLLTFSADRLLTCYRTLCRWSSTSNPRGRARSSEGHASLTPTFRATSSLSLVGSSSRARPSSEAVHFSDVSADTSRRDF